MQKTSSCPEPVLVYIQVLSLQPRVKKSLCKPVGHDGSIRKTSRMHDNDVTMALTLRELPFCNFFSTNYATLLRHNTIISRNSTETLRRQYRHFWYAPPAQISGYTHKNTLIGARAERMPICSPRLRNARSCTQIGRAHV